MPCKIQGCGTACIRILRKPASNQSAQEFGDAARVCPPNQSRRSAAAITADHCECLRRRLSLQSPPLPTTSQLLGRGFTGPAGAAFWFGRLTVRLTRGSPLVGSATSPLGYRIFFGDKPSGDQPVN